MDTLAKYRKDLDTIDGKILGLLGKRILIVKKVGAYKKTNNLPIIDRTREKKLLYTLEEKGKPFGLDRETITSIWKAIFKAAYKIEK